MDSDDRFRLLLLMSLMITWVTLLMIGRGHLENISVKRLACLNQGHTAEECIRLFR
jgi:hypothetical protein